MTNTTSTNTSQTDTPPETLSKEQLLQIKSTQERLVQLQKDLNAALDAFAAEQSLLAKIAAYWGKLPLWLKVGAGILVIIPLFIISIMTHIAVLLTISIFALVIYTASSILLSDHHHHSTQHIQKFKEIIANLSTLLVSLIELIDGLHEQLKQEIEKLSLENKALNESVSQFNEEIKKLHVTIEEYSKTEQHLKQVVKELEDTAAHLKKSVGEQSELFLKTKSQLEEVKQDYELNKIKLSESIQQMDTLKSGMESDRIKAQGIVQTLQKTVSTLQNMLTLSAEQRKVFDKKLTSYLENKEQGFEQVAVMLEETTTKLAVTTDKVKDSSLRFEELNKKQSQLIARLVETVELLEEMPKKNVPIPQCSVAALRDLSVFSKTDSPTPILKEEPGLVSTIPIEAKVY